MDELFWGRDHEDVTDWAERLSMAVEVRDLNADKFFKIAKLNLRGRARDWFRRLQPPPADWMELRTLILQKYGNVDADDIRMKLDAVKQEPRERVRKYFEHLDKLCQKGKVQDVEQRRRFLARLRPEIRKWCIVQTFADIEELVGAAIEVEKVLAELGETPYEPLREEQEEEALENNMEKQVDALKNALINFFKGNALNPEPSSYSTMSEECQICGARGHIATSCPRLNEARLNYAECNMPHRTEGGEIKSTYCAGLEHSEDEYWKKPRFGAANFLETLQDEAATTTVEDKTPQQQPRAELTEEGVDRINVLIEDEFLDKITQDEEFRTELSDRNKELVHSAQDGTSTDLVEATSGTENHTQLVSKEPPVDTRLELPEEQVSTKDEAEDLTTEEQPIEELMEEAEDAKRCGDGLRSCQE
jgi:hypothetical protein